MDRIMRAFTFKNDVYANCKFIEDDNLAQDLAAFAEENKLLDMEERIVQGGNLLWTP